MKKEIQIACSGAGLISIDLMMPFQGDLKTLSDIDLEKIKNEIKIDGFSFPIHLWEDLETANLYIIDGHQRHKALISLRKEGWIVPQIPVVMISADSYERAKHKLLAAASVYGKVNKEGVLKFLSDTSISLEDIMENFKLDLDMNDFEIDYAQQEKLIRNIDVEAHTREIKNGSKEIDPSDYNKFQHVCPKCSFEWND